LAVVIFGEGVSILKGVGIALAVVGVVLIQWQGSEAAP
jgi:multidrug transporter EmrE-like cation transporter